MVKVAEKPPAWQVSPIKSLKIHNSTNGLSLGLTSLFQTTAATTLQTGEEGARPK